MSDGTLFAFGAVVFVLGGWGLVLVGLETFRDWRLREAGTDPEEGTYLRGQGSVRDVMRGGPRDG